MDQNRNGPLQIRVKFYAKNLEMIQSESVLKSLGMDMKGIFYPKIRMGRALRESMQDGNSRLEITYTAQGRYGENELFHPMFGRKAEHDLDKAQYALD